MTELQLKLELTQVTFRNDVVDESCQGLGRKIPPGGQSVFYMKVSG
jgi:hypothetical protein